MIVGKFAVFVTEPGVTVEVPAPSDLFETMQAKHPEKLAGVYDSRAELDDIAADIATVTSIMSDDFADRFQRWGM